MRVVLAGVFVFGSMLGAIGTLSSRYGEGHWPWWSTPAVLVAVFLSLFLAMFVFNRKGMRPTLVQKSVEERIAELDAGGLLLKQTFLALRTFSVEEFEDEGPHHYIELTDRRVLYLHGQYLYDYEPITDDPQENQARLFPCTKFEILRHKEAGYVVAILCSGMVLEPELVAPHYTKEQWRRGVPEDGEIIVNKSYDDLKRERTES